MDFKNKNFLNILLFSIIGFNFSCDPKNECYYYHQVTFPITIYAESDTIQIGDTIHLNVAFSRKLKEVLYSDYVYLPEDFITHNLSIYKIDRSNFELNNTNFPGSVSSFDTNAVIGRFKDIFMNTILNINYILKNDSVFGSFNLIAKDTGTFVFYITDAASYHYNQGLNNYGISLSNTECNQSYWHGLMVNLNTNNNYYIIQKHHVHFDTTKFWYYNLNSSNPYNTGDPNNKNSMTEMKKNLEFGTFSVVVKNN